MHHHIDAGNQLAQQIPAGRIFHIQRNALLPGVQVQVQAAAFRMGCIIRERAATAGRIADAGRLRLDDLGSQRRQQLAAVGSGDEGGNLQNAEVGESDKVGNPVRLGDKSSGWCQGS